MLYNGGCVFLVVAFSVRQFENAGYAQKEGAFVCLDERQGRGYNKNAGRYTHKNFFC